MGSRRQSLGAACSAGAAAAVGAVVVGGSAAKGGRTGSTGYGRGIDPRVVASWAIIAVKAVFGRVESVSGTGVPRRRQGNRAGIAQFVLSRGLEFRLETGNGEMMNRVK